ncbi:MAG: hypothetical protein Q7S98_03835 [Deltaproteobacteria bacterium]|nr:hypothetical protein [Deltaproteobacteria bacterium]
MQKRDWEVVRRKIKKAVGQGLEVLKKGGRQASYVAGKTAHVIHLEMNIQGLKSKIERLSKELGQVVHTSLTNGHIRTTPEVKKLNSAIHHLERDLKKTKTELSETRITR